MRRTITFLTFLLMSICTRSTNSYELGTHARISSEAIQRSLSTDPILVNDLGLQRGLETHLSRLFFDLRNGPSEKAITRAVFPFDRANNVMPGLLVSVTGVGADRIENVAGWIMRGTIREDDGSKRLKPQNPHDVDDFNRFCNHFYDPKNNVKLSLSLCGGDDLTSSAAWAIGVSAGLAGAISRPLPLYPQNESRRNHYTLPDAREAMWRALTLKQFKGANGTLLADPSPDGIGLVLRALPRPTYSLGLDPTESPGNADFSGEAATAYRQYRDAYWATSFFALGSVLHLNQDMAQPQHTRIETHPFGPRGDYERYAEMRAKSDEVPDTFRSIFAGLLTPVIARPLTYSNPAASAIPSFSNFSDYWSTAADGDVSKGVGLGDHSNSRFFSLGHNLGQGFYALPSNTPSHYPPVELQDSAGDKHQYLTDYVPDPLTSKSERILMTRLTPSAAARAQRGWPSSPRVGNKLDYMMDTRVYDDYLGLLVPLAARYSTGLINHFFRGRMQISAPDEGVYGLVDHAIEYIQYRGDGFSKIKAKVANTSATDEILAGYIVAVGKFRRNTCYSSDFSELKPRNGSEAASCRSSDEEIVVSKPIAVAGVARSPTQFTFEFPDKIPINSTDLRLQVVFRGQLGNEPDVVVVAGKDLYEPTFVSVHNNKDYITINENAYTEEEVDLVDMAVFLKIVPQGCVIYPSPPNPPLPKLDKNNPFCFIFGRVMDISYQIGSRPTTVVIKGLPVRQYSRFAYLADSETTTLRQSDGNCSSPSDSWPLSNVKWQSDVVDPVSGISQLIYSKFHFSRGIWGWTAASCILGGDGRVPTTDKYWTQMAPLPKDLKPTPVTQIDF